MINDYGDPYIEWNEANAANDESEPEPEPVSVPEDFIPRATFRDHNDALLTIVALLRYSREVDGEAYAEAVADKFRTVKYPDSPKARSARRALEIAQSIEL